MKKACRAERCIELGEKAGELTPYGAAKAWNAMTSWLVEIEPCGGRTVKFADLFKMIEDSIKYAQEQSEREAKSAGYEIMDNGGGQKFIRCLRCGWASYNPNDIGGRYCGHCHIFHEPKTT